MPGLQERHDVAQARSVRQVSRVFRVSSLPSDGPFELAPKLWDRLRHYLPTASAIPYWSVTLIGRKRFNFSLQ